MVQLFKSKTQNKQLLCNYGVFIINGMLALSIGSLLPYIRDARGLEYAFCGMIVSLHSVGNLISGFASGALPAILGKKKSILLFNAFFALSYLVIIISDNNYLLALAFFLTGMARGATSNFCNKSINELAPGKASILNGLHAMFAIGAFTFPLLLLALTSTDASNWIYACYFMLIMGILSWILYFIVPVSEDTAKKDQKQATDGFAFFKEPLFYLCTLTLFFYLCAEQGVIGWMITYFKDTGLLPASLSQATASVLWVMILAGRLLTAWLSSKIQKEWLLLVMGFGLVGFFILLLFSSSTPLILTGIMGFGFSMAGLYPTTVSFAGGIIQKYSLAWSFILTIASFGSIVMPSIIGKIAETAGIFYGMQSIIAVVIIDFICITLLVRYIRKLRNKNIPV
ncbi:MFS transporter [Mediterraneibacter gnavus]|uniref:MFS transporter n=1 Tax=Mediterraneibacter gnavus TaxID=33038 RepID=UPI000E531799|nr:MFS transporter [Mediterraneibacter gnavus]